MKLLRNISTRFTSRGGEGDAATNDGDHPTAMVSSPSSISISTGTNISSPVSTATATASPSSGVSNTAFTIADSEHSRQNNKVCCIRLAMITTLFAATTIVATFIGTYISADERSKFELQYRDSVSEVADGFQHRIATKQDIAKTLSTMVTSQHGSYSQETNGERSPWPNVTLPNFQELSEGSLHITDIRALSFNPIITQNKDRLAWEAYAVENAWMLGNQRLTTPEPWAKFPKNRTVSFGIYSRDADGNVIYDPGHSPESPSQFQNIMAPVWQIAPVETNAKAVMFNLHSESNRRQALDHMMEHKVPVLTAMLQLVQDVEVRPSSILFYPIFEAFESNNEIISKDAEDEDTLNEEQNVVGSISIVFSWDTLLDKILPDYIKGMVCVIQSSTEQTFSYSISGDDVTLLGEGDRHDPVYEQYGHHVQAKLLLEGTQKFITYQMKMYPSREFELLYVTNRAGIYSAGVVLIFLFTSALFLLYDYLVENRQKRTTRLARQTGNVVEGLFPAAFRERLYSFHSRENNEATNERLRRSTIDSAGSGKMSEVAAKASRFSIASGTSNAEDASNSGITVKRQGSVLSVSNPIARVQSSSSKMGSAIRSAMGKIAMKQIDDQLTSPAQHSGVGAFLDDEPIAELFHGTSIMFSDIVGFTKWSSEHSPNQVFRLLEQIFWEFDDIAARLHIFKLGTIGDCYIAVTGIPDPVHDHATQLTRFAFEARNKVREVCARLDWKEGLGTAKLDMRFGIHSGATTAGILRGTKSRFELFGDTINTASRMESTGSGGKIQVSEETAELIRRDGKAQWLHKRENTIEAKGKGRLQTYWVEPDLVSKRVSFSERVSNFFMDDSLDARGCDNFFYQHGYNASGRHLSQWDGEEKLEEDDLEADVVDLFGASKDDNNTVDDNAKVPTDTKTASRLDDDGAQESKNVMADESV